MSHSLIASGENNSQIKELRIPECRGVWPYAPTFFYKSISFTVLNSNHHPVKNAVVRVNEKIIPFDQQQIRYFLRDSIPANFSVTVTCDGYDKLRYSKSELSCSSSPLKCVLFLIKPGEKYFYHDFFKRPYPPHPDKLVVHLKDPGSIDEFKKEIHKKGLLVNDTIFEPQPDTLNQFLPLTILVNSGLIIQKEDGSDFDSAFCQELGFLRELDMVQVAGPFIQHTNQPNDFITYDNILYVRQRLRYNSHEEINQMLKQIDHRFYIDEKRDLIVLPNETNEIIPQIIEQMYKLGFKGLITMNVFYNECLD